MLISNSLSQAEQLVGQTITSTDGDDSGVVSRSRSRAAERPRRLTNGDTVPLATGAIVQ